MTIKVHGFPLSTATATVLVTLWEKEADFEFVAVDLLHGAHKQPEYLAHQPFGQIPYLEDGDYEIYESRAVAKYVADRFAGQGTELYPKDLKLRGKVDQWIEVEAHNYSKPAIAIALEKYYAPLFHKRPGNEEVAQENIKKLGEVLDIYEAQLAKHKYIAGDDFSLADVTHIVPTNHVLRAAPEVAEIFKSRPHVQAWWDDVSSRPAWKKYVELASPYFPKHE